MVIDIAAIEARLAAATPGEWTRDAEDVEVLDDPDAPRGYRQHSTVASCVTCATAELIAHAPTDLAALVAEVRRLREAAAAPVVHLVAGQVAVWPWDMAGHSLATVCGSAFRVYELNSHSDGFTVFDYFRGVTMANGTAPDVESAKAAALDAVVELARARACAAV